MIVSQSSRGLRRQERENLPCRRFRGVVVDGVANDAHGFADDASGQLVTLQHVHDFHVDAGRFCVMLSRHRAACVLVGRAGIATGLDQYTPGNPPPLGTEEDAEFEGWSAHRAMLTRLEEMNRIVALAV